MLYIHDNEESVFKHIKRNVKFINLIQSKELECGIQTNLLVAIFIVESMMRPFYFRLAEYCVLCLEILASLVFKRTIKNYTIGKFQIGLSYILNFNGRNLYSHVDRIPPINLQDAVNVFSSLKFKKHINIVIYRILPLIRQADRIYPPGQIYRERNICTYVGEQYNGRFAYGLLISKIVETLNTEVDSTSSFLQVAP